MNKRTEKRWTLEMVCAGALLVGACSSNDAQNTGPDYTVFPTVGGQPGLLGAGGAAAGAPAAAGSAAVVTAPATGGQPSALGAGGATLLGMGGQLVGGSGGDLGAGGAAGQAGGAGAAGQAMGAGGFMQFGPDIAFTMKGTIQPGAEAMFCSYGKMPTTGKTAIPSAESHYTPGSHHFLVFRSTLTSVPAGGDVAHLCGTTNQTVAMSGAANGIASFEAVMGSTGSYYEAQTPDARRDLPPGVAHVFTPGEILILTAHYLNTTPDTIDSTIDFRLHPMDPAMVKQEAGTFFLLDTQLNIPPNSAVTATKACPITKDINLGLLWSHMHSRGYSFRAWTDDKAATTQLGGGDVYDQPGPDGWAEPHVQTYPYDPPVTLHAGSKLTISCTYHNTTSKTFTFGQSAATAEMCLLHGMYWPRLDSATEQCSNGTATSGTPGPIPSGM